MNSNNNLQSVLGDFSRSFTELTNLIQSSSTAGTASGSALQNARSSLSSLRSDAGLANDVSLSFNRVSSNTSTGSSSAPANLPSVARKQRSSHRFSPTVVAERNGRFDVKLMVVDHISELFRGTRSTANYRGEAVIETAFYLMEDQTVRSVRTTIIDIIRGQFDEF